MSTGKTPTYITQTPVSFKKFLKDHYIDELKTIIDNKHYFLAFLVISSGIEFLGKLLDDDDFFSNNGPRRKFNLALEKLESLNCYFTLGLRKTKPATNTTAQNKKKNKKKKTETQDQNEVDTSFFEIIRCGIVHASCPEPELILSEWENDFNADTKVVGLNSLYNDFVKACNKLLNGEVQLGEGKSLDDTLFYTSN